MRLFCVFVVFAAHVLLNAVISRVLAWFWVDFRKIAFFYDTAFWRFGALDFLRLFVGCCYFSSFGLFFMCLVQDQDFENYLFSTSAVICRQALLLNSLCC